MANIVIKLPLCIPTPLDHTNLQGKLLPKPPVVRLLWFHRVEQRQPNHVRPNGRRGRAAHPADELQLGELVTGLEDGFPCEQLAQDAAATPHVNAGAVALLAEE